MFISRMIMYKYCSNIVIKKGFISWISSCVIGKKQPTCLIMTNIFPSKGDSSASKLRVIAFNANSIGKQPKRRQVLCFLERKKPDLLVVVDTRFSKEIENSVKAEWGGQVLFSSYSSQSRGVAIFIKKRSSN